MFPTVDHTPRLNAFALHHAGAFVPGAITQWCYSGQITHLLASARAESGRLHVRINGGPEVAVAVDRVPGTRGNDWPLLVCGGCGARRWHLYCKDNAVACRACLGLRYACRHEFRYSPVRKLLRASRLRARMVTSRRSMRSRKRRATLAKIAQLEARAAEAINAVIERLAEAGGHD